MNTVNGKPVGATVLPEAGGRTKPDSGVANAAYTFNSYIKKI